MACSRFPGRKSIIGVFSEFIKNFSCTIQYNGDSFDQPYLQARYKFYELPDPFEGISSFDLYKVLRPLKGFLKLPGLKQEQMEAFPGRFPRHTPTNCVVKCPWDKKQTNGKPWRPNTIEETYELCDALMRDDKQDICKELGDVLLHVAFYAR